MAKCDNHRCPVCYPNWREEEAAAKKRAQDEKQDCINCWRFYQKKAEAIVSVDDPIARNRRINAVRPATRHQFLDPLDSRRSRPFEFP